MTLWSCAACGTVVSSVNRPEACEACEYDGTGRGRIDGKPTFGRVRLND